MYDKRKMLGFFTLNHVNIALHQMCFLAMSYGPFLKCLSFLKQNGF